eukprot:TRINITY_DN35420_c0_g1_i3.p1 TRINITY_DN35420_c0_g1~~TRINITY_DN35420_c0_g1_i3.p1  ORF type:complete len:231 (+),score=4.10 TRINITY_DN35420_c0_g1_i3:36-695(+)
MTASRDGQQGTKEKGRRQDGQDFLLQLTGKVSAKEKFKGTQQESIALDWTTGGGAATTEGSAARARDAAVTGENSGGGGGATATSHGHGHQRTASTADNLEPSTLMAILNGNEVDVSETTADKSRALCQGDGSSVKGDVIPRFTFSLTPDGHLRFDGSRVSAGDAWVAAAQSEAGAVVRLRALEATVNAYGQPVQVRNNQARGIFPTKRNCVIFRVRFT